MDKKTDEQKRQEQWIISSLENSLINIVPMKVIQSFSNWLSSSNIELFNSAVHAVNTILLAKGKDFSKKDISLKLLQSDIVNDIIRPGDPILKHSLFSIINVLLEHTFEYEPIRYNPNEGMFEFEVPLIAHLSSEHYIAITQINGAEIQHSDMGKEKTMSRDKLITYLTNIALVPHPDKIQHVKFRKMSDTECAYVWG